MARTRWVSIGAITLVLSSSLCGGCEEDMAGSAPYTALGLHERQPERDLRTAPDPTPISAEEVRADLAALGPGEPMGVRDFQRLLRAYRAAHTTLAYQWLTAHAAQIARDRPGRSSRAFLDRLVREQARAQVVPSVTTGVPSTAECHVGFDTYESLNALPDAAQDSWAFEPYYLEPCRDGFVHVEPLQFGHYHLGYEDPTINCFDDDGLWGRGEFGDCTALEDPATEPRLLGAHRGDQVIRIWRSSSDDPTVALPFSLQSFVNVGGEDVKIRYRKTTGDWFEWSSLASNTMWILSPHADDVDEILITNAGTSLDCGGDFLTTAAGCPVEGNPYFVDDFAIDP